MGFCPVHRHPVFVRFIDAMHGLLSRVYGRILEEIDLYAVETMQRSARDEELFDQSLGCGTPVPPIFWLFERHFLYKAELVMNGWWSIRKQFSNSGHLLAFRVRRHCKGISMS